MIKVRCRTNLDEYRRYEWPTELAGMPAVGDWIYALDGNETHVLAVVHVAHRFYVTDSGPRKAHVQYVDLELHRDQRLIILAQLRGEIPMERFQEIK